jgi:hypothetical protein
MWQAKRVESNKEEQGTGIAITREWSLDRSQSGRFAREPSGV